jgi:FkbM family methyltransferase
MYYEIIKKMLKIKRKLFFEDAMTARMLFRDDNVSDIPDIHQLLFVMKNKYIKYVRRDPETKRLILKTKEGTYLSTDKFHYILQEVFGSGLYDVDDKYFSQPFVAFDLGMNRAYASLFFAQMPNCQKVFGYEPDPETYEFAKFNIELNPHLKSKIEPFSYGLGDKNATLDFYKIAGRDSVGCLNPSENKIIFQTVDKKNVNKISVPIKKASDEFRNTINIINMGREGGEVKTILKIDVEGAEYDIFKSLYESGMVEKIDMIFGDLHDGLRPEFEKLKGTHNLVHLTREGKNGCHGFILEKKGSWK